MFKLSMTDGQMDRWTGGQTDKTSLFYLHDTKELDMLTKEFVGFVPRVSMLAIFVKLFHIDKKCPKQVATCSLQLGKNWYCLQGGS